MSYVPAVWKGATAVMLVSETTVKSVAATAPKLTALAPVKLAPVIVTVVPPLDLPAVGVIEVTEGAGAKVTVNWSLVEVADTPLGVTTVISNVPAAWGGAAAVMLVDERTVKLLASTEPKNTSLAPE